ncbi:MAG: hypothetical protein IT426_10445 [Pirellulales bacterium]|nr:hypothetical protein [Pirellulales bacterium]
MSILRRLIDLLRGRYRLETAEMLPLGSSVRDTIKLYGPPLAKEASEETEEITRYTFAVGDYHMAIAYEWHERIQSIIYESEKADPTRDILCMFNRYGEGIRWKVIEEGYWYLREDGKVKLWCSVAPVIGVGYVEFLAAMQEYKKAKSLKELDSVQDVVWAPDEAIFELQRLYVEEHKPGLMEFAARSDKIAASPDGRQVFIVRNHHAYEVEGGFREYNAPPEDENGLSTQVINVFSKSDDSSMWSKIVLPRDAKVELIRFEGPQYHLMLRRTSTNRVLSFRGTASSIFKIGIYSESYVDEDLWKELEKYADSSA